jgi:hypothetical protein
MDELLNKSDADILKILQKSIPTPTNFVVDIGASYGVPTDPTYPFISSSEYRGLCVEGDKSKINSLKTKTKFYIYDNFIYPHDILDVFKYYNVPETLDILKIDIDGYDLEVLRKILSTYKPSIIIAEINEKIPPPIQLEVKYKSDYAWDESHMYGFSIQAGDSVMRSFGYSIFKIFDLNNILCVRKDLLDMNGLGSTRDVSTIYKEDYKSNLRRFKELPWNENVNHWVHIKDVDVLKETIVEYYTKSNDRSKFAVKTKILDVDFSIGV